MCMYLQVHAWRPGGTLGILLCHSLPYFFKRKSINEYGAKLEPSSPSVPPLTLPPSISVSRMQNHG